VVKLALCTSETALGNERFNMDAWYLGSVMNLFQLKYFHPSSRDISRIYNQRTSIPPFDKKFSNLKPTASSLFRSTAASSKNFLFKVVLNFSPGLTMPCKNTQMQKAYMALILLFPKKNMIVSYGILFSGTQSHLCASDFVRS